MVNKQRLGNPQLQIRVDRKILAAAERKLGGRAGVNQRIKAMLAGEIEVEADPLLQALQVLKDLNAKTLEVAGKQSTAIGEVAGVMKVMVERLDKLDERFNNLDERLKKIESNHALTQRAILLLAERLGAAEARSPAPPTGKKG